MCVLSLLHVCWISLVVVLVSVPFFSGEILHHRHILASTSPSKSQCFCLLKSIHYFSLLFLGTWPTMRNLRYFSILFPYFFHIFPRAIQQSSPRSPLFGRFGPGHASGAGHPRAACAGCHWPPDRTPSSLADNSSHNSNMGVSEYTHIYIILYWYIYISIYIYMMSIHVHPASPFYIHDLTFLKS